MSEFSYDARTLSEVLTEADRRLDEAVSHGKTSDILGSLVIEDSASPEVWLSAALAAATIHSKTGQVGQHLGQLLETAGRAVSATAPPGCQSCESDRSARRGRPWRRGYALVTKRKAKGGPHTYQATGKPELRWLYYLAALCFAEMRLHNSKELALQPAHTNEAADVEPIGQASWPKDDHRTFLKELAWIIPSGRSSGRSDPRMEFARFIVAAREAAGAFNDTSEPKDHAEAGRWLAGIHPDKSQGFTRGMDIDRCPQSVRLLIRHSAEGRAGLAMIRACLTLMARKLGLDPTMSEDANPEGGDPPKENPPSGTHTSSKAPNDGPEVRGSLAAYELLAELEAQQPTQEDKTQRIVQSILAQATAQGPGRQAFIDAFTQSMRAIQEELEDEDLRTALNKAIALVSSPQTPAAPSWIERARQWLVASTGPSPNWALAVGIALLVAIPAIIMKLRQPPLTIKGTRAGAEIVLGDAPCAARELGSGKSSPCLWRFNKEALFPYYRLEHSAPWRYAAALIQESNQEVSVLYPQGADGAIEPTVNRPECREGFCQLFEGAHYTVQPGRALLWVVFLERPRAAAELRAAARQDDFGSAEVFRFDLEATPR